MAKADKDWTPVVLARGDAARRAVLTGGLGYGDAGEYVFYNEDAGRLQIWNGTTWENLSGFDE
jgi:hypothetical protein